MAEERRVIKLLGTWASPFVVIAKAALKIKGIEYDFIEEDLGNKSELLLQSNPVHQKVPVLVHNGLPIAESSVILEYIDETWTDPPYLLPKDPYQRAKHRFWAAFFTQVLETLGRALLLSSQGKSTEEMMNEFCKKLDVAEKLMGEIIPNGVPCFQDDVKLGYLDIVLYSLSGTSNVAEESLGFKPMTKERFPLLTSWIKAISEVAEVKDVFPPKHKLLELLHAMRQKSLLAPKA